MNATAGKRLLVVDDEPDLLSLLKVRLQANGYVVATASDGQDALEKVRQDPPDLIILDLMLPKIDGYKVCSLLKRDLRFTKIPIMLFTARAQPEDVAMGFEVGADAYVTKPFVPPLLLRKIKELLRSPQDS